MSIVLQSSGGGSVTVQEPATASNFTQNLPAASGEVMVSGNQPAFSAYSSTTQVVANVTATKVIYNNEEFDTANCYDHTTNYRFTPNVAGYYFVHAFFEFAGASANATSANIYKNGSLWRRGQFFASTSGNNKVECTDFMYMNGSTDYIEIYQYQSSGGNLSNQNGNGQQYSVFQAFLARAA
jgi:hypothetical protein